MDSTDLTWLTRLWLSRLGRPIDHCLWLADALGEFRPFSPDSLAIHPYIDWGSQCCWFHTWSVLSWITRGPCRQTPATKRNPGLCIFRFSQTMGSILENMVSFCCSYVSGCSGTCFRLTLQQAPKSSQLDDEQLQRSNPWFQPTLCASFHKSCSGSFQRLSNEFHQSEIPTLLSRFTPPWRCHNLRFVAAERLQHFHKLALSYREGGRCKATQKTSYLPVGALVSARLIALHSFEKWVKLLAKLKKLDGFKPTFVGSLVFDLWVRTCPNGPGLKPALRTPFAVCFSCSQGISPSRMWWCNIALTILCWMAWALPSKRNKRLGHAMFFDTGAERCGPERFHVFRWFKSYYSFHFPPSTLGW